MRSTVRSSRLSIEESVPLTKVIAHPGVFYLIFGGGTGALILAGVSAHGAMNRIHLILLGVLCLTLLIYMRAFIGAVLPRHIRVVEGDGLTFVRPRSLSILPYVMGVAAVLPGLASLLAPALTGETFALSASQLSRSDAKLGALMLIGVFAVGQQLWALRLPVGLNVSEWGLTGVRGGSKVRIPWELVLCAEVVDRRGGARLRIMSTDYDTYAYARYEIGSDPNVVAAVIEHFRENPKDRGSLVNAGKALRLAEDAEDD